MVLPLTDVVIALCALWVIVRFRELTGRQSTAMMMIASVLIVNAVFCVLASGISDRYQARIAWVLPLFILSFAFARRGAMFALIRQRRR